jgi:hypothetical protein
LRSTVTCQREDHDVFGMQLTTIDDALLPPCGSMSCGPNGECVEINGFATCRCATGYAALPNLDAPLPLCEAIARLKHVKSRACVFHLAGP